MTDQNLSRQVGVVTGAARGLGRAFAVALSKAGMSLAIVDLRQDELNETVKEIESGGGRAIALAADISDAAAVSSLIKSVEQKLGPIELLVNNAALAGPAGPTWEADPDAWWRCQEVNLRGPFLCCHAALPGMITRRRGRIINVASAAGTVAVPYLSAYVTSKAALIRFTETLAYESRPFGVSIFALHPGAVRTPMNEELLTTTSQKWLPWLEHIFQRGEDETTEPGANMVLFLASGKADELSGKFFMVPENPADLVGRTNEIVQKDLYTLRLRHPKI
jgi:NAD(P)-dependent dehydrogenase (short-subunit alcohol dehydrogenase family)